MNFGYHVYKGCIWTVPTFGSIQITQVLIPYLFEINFSIVIPSITRSHMWPLPFIFLTYWVLHIFQFPHAHPRILFTTTMMKFSAM